MIPLLARQEIFLLSKVFRSALVLSHYPIQWVLEALPLEVKQPE
jgi:hypothetical protein